MSEKQDIRIQCIEKGCDQVRLFSVKDQEFYAEKGFTPPKRCRTHSQQARRAHESRSEENQQDKREGWNNDRGRGPRFPGHESDASMLAD